MITVIAFITGILLGVIIRHFWTNIAGLISTGFGTLFGKMNKWISPKEKD